MARLGSFSSHSAQVFPVVRELLDAVVGSAHPDPVLSVHAQRDGSAHSRGTVLVLGGRSKSAGIGALRAPEREELPVRRELLNAIHSRVGRIDVAGPIKRYELRPR